MSQEIETGSSSGVDPKLAAFLSYFLSFFISFIGGLIFFLIEKDNKFTRFHAMQAILLNAAMIVLGIAGFIVSGILSFIPILGPLVGFLIFTAIGIGGLVLLIIAMIKSFQGEWYKIPVIGEFAEKYV